MLVAIALRLEYSSCKDGGKCFMGKTRGRRFEKEGNVRWESKGSNYESSDELATASGVYDQEPSFHGAFGFVWLGGEDQ